MSKFWMIVALSVANTAFASETPELSVGSTASGITLVVGGILIYLDMKRRSKDK